MKKKKTSSIISKIWQNRIIRSGEVAPEKLLASPFNWRAHEKAQTEAMVGVLDEVGWVQQILVNQRAGHIVDGHLRVQEAIRSQEKPCR